MVNIHYSRQPDPDTGRHGMFLDLDLYTTTINFEYTSKVIHQHTRATYCGLLLSLSGDVSRGKLVAAILCV